MCQNAPLHQLLVSDMIISGDCKSTKSLLYYTVEKFGFCIGVCFPVSHALHLGDINVSGDCKVVIQNIWFLDVCSRDHYYSSMWRIG